MVGRLNVGYTNVRRKSPKNILVMIWLYSNFKVEGFGMKVQIITIIKEIRGQLLATLQRYITLTEP